MNGGSSAPYLACTPCVPLFCTLFNRGGNCEFLDVLCPGFAPNPFLYSSGFGVSLLGLFWSGRSSPSRRSLRFALLQHCTYNACITSEAGGGQDSHPRHRITITIAFRIPRILGEERATRNAPFT